jgi:hypothetical protein
MLSSMGAPRSFLGDTQVLISQYDSNFSRPGAMGLLDFTASLADAAQPALDVKGDRDLGSVGLEVVPPSTLRSPGMVCYTRSPGSTPTSPRGSPPLVPVTPSPHVLEPAAVVPDTLVVGAKTRAARGPRPSQPPCFSSRLALAREGLAGTELTVAEQAVQQAAIHNLDPGTSGLSPPPPSPSGSRFSVLDESLLEHLSQVASDSGVVFRGERGTQLAQIVAIKAREIYAGTLAAARAQAQWEQADPSMPAGSGQPMPGSREGGSPLLGTEEATRVTSQMRETRGRPPKATSRPSTSSRAQSIPRKGITPTSVIQ